MLPPSAEAFRDRLGFAPGAGETSATAGRCQQAPRHCPMEFAAHFHGIVIVRPAGKLKPISQLGLDGSAGFWDSPALISAGSMLAFTSHVLSEE